LSLEAPRDAVEESDRGGPVVVRHASW
jgi:hypothetical protein